MTRHLTISGVLLCAFCLSAFGQKVYDRGYDMKQPSAVIAPKGSWSLGGSAGFGISKQTNYSVLVVNGINADSHFVLFSPQFCYYFADNMGVGLSFKYKRDYLVVDSAKASLGETSISIENYNYLLHQYLGTAFFRYYLPFGNTGRFAGFADAGFGLGGSTSNVVDKDGRGGYDNGFNMTVGVNVGALAMLTSHLGIDVKLGLLEFNYGTVWQENNVGSSKYQERVSGTAQLVGANFMIDLLTLSFGVHYFL